MTTVLSGAAFVVWVIMAAFACGRGRLSPPVSSGMFCFRGLGADCLAVASFFFIPPGSLPPFINHAWGGVFCLGFLAVSFCLSRGHKAVPGLAVLTFVCGVAFFYARQRGMPGGFANLGTFAAMPLWSVVSAQECAAFLLLALAAVLAARSLVAPDSGESAAVPSLSFMAVCAMLVPLFFPWTLAPFVDWPAWAAAGSDFILFWIKTACCVYGLHLFPCNRRFAARTAAFCTVLGSAPLFILME